MYLAGRMVALMAARLVLYLAALWVGRKDLSSAAPMAGLLDKPWVELKVFHLAAQKADHSGHRLVDTMVVVMAVPMVGKKALHLGS